MYITIHKEIEPNNLEYNDILGYLSQIVISKTSSEIMNKKDKLHEITNIIKNGNSEIKNYKELLVKKSQEIKRLRIVKRIISSVNTLIEESVLQGNKSQKILTLITDLNNKSYNELRAIEDKLEILNSGLSSRTIIKQ